MFYCILDLCFDTWKMKYKVIDITCRVNRKKLYLLMFLFQHQQNFPAYDVGSWNISDTRFDSKIDTKNSSIGVDNVAHNVLLRNT